METAEGVFTHHLFIWQLDVCKNYLKSVAVQAYHCST